MVMVEMSVNILLQPFESHLSVFVPSFLSSPSICIVPVLSTNLFVAPVITIPLRFGDTSRTSLNENPEPLVVLTVGSFIEKKILLLQK
jgi:hypothetical protein